MAGCAAHKTPPAVAHYLDPSGGIVTVNRVVFLPLVNNTDYPDIEKGLADDLVQTIQARQVFRLEVAPSSTEAPSTWGRAGNRAFSLKELAEMRRAFGCDAVLIGAVNSFQPYPHMGTGLYLRLVDLRGGQLLWAVDHTWDSGNRQTQRRIEAFFDRCQDTGDNPLEWRVALVSSRAFQGFVAQEVAETLPDRTPAR